MTTARIFSQTVGAATARCARFASRAAAGLAFVGLVLAGGAAHAQIGAPNGRPEAASVVASSGETRLMRPSALLTPLRPGEPIRAGDRVLTGADGRVQLRFMDGALVAVQPHSDFRIEEFRFDANGERSFVSLARGAIRTVTGAIGRRNHGDYRLQTPTATIGIRGTDFETVESRCGETGAGCRPGERSGLTVTVFQGRVAVTNDAGTIVVPEGSMLRVRSRAEPGSFGPDEPATRRNGGAGGRRAPGAGTQRGPAGSGGGAAQEPLIEKAPALY